MGAMMSNLPDLTNMALGFQHGPSVNSRERYEDKPHPAHRAEI
jgi:hypothetical protein